MKELLAFILLIAPTTVPQDSPLRETEQAKVIGEARGWQIEVPMPDGTRCDLISKTHAIEVDWCPKWAEAVGQSISYSIWTGKKPGIILLKKGNDPQAEKIDILRCRLACERTGIDLEVVNAVYPGD